MYYLVLFSSPLQLCVVQLTRTPPPCARVWRCDYYLQCIAVVVVVVEVWSCSCSSVCKSASRGCCAQPSIAHKRRGVGCTCTKFFGGSEGIAGSLRVSGPSRACCFLSVQPPLFHIKLIRMNGLCFRGRCRATDVLPEQFVCIRMSAS